MKLELIDLVNLFGETANENEQWFGKDSENVCLMLAETNDPDHPNNLERRRLAAFTAGRGDKIIAVLTRAMMSNPGFKDLIFATVQNYEDYSKELNLGDIEDQNDNSTHELRFND